MTTALKVQRDIISLETFSITSPGKMIKSIPSMVENLKEFLKNLKSTDDIELKSDQKTFLKKIDAINYVDMINLSINIPAGFYSTFPDYLTELDTTVKNIKDIEKDVLEPFTNYLAKLVSVQDHKFDTSSYFLQLEKQGNETKEDLARLSKFFNKGVSTNAKMGDVIARNSDWKKVLETLNRINNNLNDIDRKSIDKKVSELSSYLDIVNSKITKDELDNVSPEVVRSIAEGVYQVANQLESLSAISYQAMAITKTIDEFVGKINNMDD